MMAFRILFWVLPVLTVSLTTMLSTHGRFHGLKPRYDYSPSEAYTLTASTKTKAFKNHLKVTANDLGFIIGQSDSGTYCPEPASSCPQPGNETVVLGDLTLSAEVPGGQETYINSDGLVAYTQAHSDDVPAGALTGGFMWTAFNASHHRGIDPDCPQNDQAYDCSRGTGIITYQYNSTLGGLWACCNPNTSDSSTETWQLFAATPDFNPDAHELTSCSDSPCTRLVGLVTHPWTGAIPAAWQYA